MEAALIERRQVPPQEAEGIDPRTLPQMTIRKVMRECLSKGVFNTALDISKHPLVSMVPWEIAKKYKPKTGQER